jgi:SAM-dependent methyltransferase
MLHNVTQDCVRVDAKMNKEFLYHSESYENSRMLPVKTLLFSYVEFLEKIEDLTTTSDSINLDSNILIELVEETNRFLSTLHIMESNLTSAEKINAHSMILKATDKLLSQSWFFSYARNWPEGFAGDFKIMDAIAQMIPRSATMFGKYLDLLFLSQPYAKAVGNRFTAMLELLESEISSRPYGQKLLDVNCGNCREMYLLKGMLTINGAEVTCIDSSASAIQFSKKLFEEGSLGHEQFACERFNVINLLSEERTPEKFQDQDVLFAVNIFELFTDRISTNLLRVLYNLVAPGGVMLLGQQDRKSSDMQLVNSLTRWETFFNRSVSICFDLLADADLQGAEIEIMPTASKSVTIFAIRKQ